MTSNRIVTIASYTTGPEAHIVANALKAAGIQVSIANETMVTWFWQLSNAIGGVKVQVHHADVQRAIEILSELGYLSIAEGKQTGVSPGTDWVCPECGASVDAGFEICWQCETPVKDYSKGEASPSTDLTLQETATAPIEDSLNEPLEDQARRASFAAILGVLFCPLLLNIYSTLLLFRMRGQWHLLEEKSRLRAKIAIAINIVMFVSFAILITFSFFPTDNIQIYFGPISMKSGPVMVFPEETEIELEEVTPEPENENIRFVDLQHTKYKPGQRWLYHTRQNEPQSSLVILKIEWNKHWEEVVHVRIEGLNVIDAEAPNRIIKTIPHTVYTAAALDRSVTTLSEKLSVLPDFARGYQWWKEKNHILVHVESKPDTETVDKYLWLPSVWDEPVASTIELLEKPPHERWRDQPFWHRQ